MPERTHSRRTVLAAGTTLAAAGLAGCAGVLGGGGANGEVTENEFDGDIEVLDHEIENARLGGSEMVKVDATVTNETDDAIVVAAVAEFFDGDGVSLAESPSSEAKRITPSQDVQLHPAAQGRVEDVARYELRLVEGF